MKLMYSSTALVVAALAGAALLIASKQPRAKSTRLSASITTTEPIQTSAKAETPPPSVAVLRRSPAVSAAPLPAETAVERLSGPAQEPSREPPSRADQKAYVDTAFSQEASDPTWSRVGERAINDMLRPVAGSSVLESIECRSSLCRVAASHNTQDDYDTFVDAVLSATRSGWRGAIYVVRDEPDAKGTVRNTVFFAKEGHEMPRLD